MEQRVAVVTGAAQGLGQAMAQRLAQDGFHVVLVDRSEQVRERAAELAQSGWRASAVVADLLDSPALPAMAQNVLHLHGRCDVLVNNAGIHLKKANGERYRLEDLTPDNWASTLAVNLTAPLLLCQAFLPGMKRRQWGRVINVSSRAGRTYTAASSPSYATTKAGIVGLTRSMAGEYAPHGITCNCVAPGRIRTPMAEASDPVMRANALKEIPVGRLGEPAEIAATVGFLASEEAGFVTGAVIDVNGGSFMA